MKNVLLNSFFDDRKAINYMQNSGKTYQDYHATLLYWYEKDKEELQKRTLGADFLSSKNI